MLEWQFEDGVQISKCEGHPNNESHIIASAIYCDKCEKFIGRSMYCGCGKNKFLCNKCHSKSQKKLKYSVNMRSAKVTK